MTQSDVHDSLCAIVLHYRVSLWVPVLSPNNVAQDWLKSSLREQYLGVSNLSTLSPTDL